MIILTKRKMTIWLCIVLYFFIATDIVSGAGKVPEILMKLNSIFLDLYFILLLAMFLLMAKQKIDKIQSFVTWMMTWQFLVAIMMQSEISFSMVYQLAGWPLLFVIIYQATKEDRFELPTLKYVSLLWLLVALYVVYILRTAMWNDMYRVYYLIAAVPFYICLQDKWKYSRLVLTIILITFTYKRTAFMALIIGLVVFYICDVYTQRKGIKRCFSIVILFLCLIAAIVLFDKYGGNLGVVRRLQNISNDKGSGRFTIWLTLLNYFKSENIFYKIIGNGYKGCLAVLDYRYAGAHNDFIEILIDYGLIGLINHIIFVGIIGKNLIHYLQMRAIDAGGFAYMFVVWFILMMLSFITWQSILMKPVAMYFAYMLAKFKYDKSKISVR